MSNKNNRLNALSLLERRLQKMEENIFGAHAQNVELKKQNLSKPRETKSAPSRRGHIRCCSINWGRSFSATWSSMVRSQGCRRNEILWIGSFAKSKNSEKSCGFGIGTSETNVAKCGGADS